MPDFFSRFERSWRLIQTSMEVLRADNALLILPVLSGLSTTILGAGFVAMAFWDGTFEAMRHAGHSHFSGPVYAWLFCWYVVQYFVVIFFNTALVGAAIGLLGGGRPTLGSALKLAASRVGPILGYAVISATVGVLLRMLAERLGIIGRLIEGVLGLAWTGATFLVVPILAAEGIGPWQAVERSTALLRKTWGENLIGSGGISLVMSAITGLLGVAAVCGGVLVFQSQYQVLGAVVLSAAVTALVLALMIGAALSAIYAAAVYYYAVLGEPPVDFDADLVRGAFTPKGT